MLFATDWSGFGLQPDVLAAGAAISGVFDLEPLIQVPLLNSDLRLDLATARAMSPVRLSSQVAAPLLLAVGADETSEFVRQSQLQWEAWPTCRPPRASGPLVVPNRHHFSVLSDLENPASELFERLFALFPA